jgi:hypothetical protein
MVEFACDACPGDPCTLFFKGEVTDTAFPALCPFDGQQVRWECTNEG